MTKKGQTVVTFNGSTALREDCRKIKNEYYKVGNVFKKDSGGCFKIGEKFYRINSGLITWDYEKQEYLLSNCDMIYGYVEKDVRGYFTPNPIKNVYIRHNCPLLNNIILARESVVPCINTKVAELNSDFLSYIDGYYYNLKTLDEKDQVRSRIYHVKEFKRYYYGKEPYKGFDSGTYNISESSSVSVLKKVFELSPLDIQNYSKELYKVFDGLSFGYEEETQGGRLPEYMLYKYGIVPLKDGSITGHEYTSIPYKDEKGLQAFIDAFANGYNSHCAVDQNCSLHYHIGNIFEKLSEQDTKLLLIAIYMLYFYIQNEVWEIIPPYKRSNEYFREKKEFKDHCKPIKTLQLIYNNIYNQDGSINKDQLAYWFNILFRFVNDGVAQDSTFNFKSRIHIKSGQPKWHIDSRYYSINFYNALFAPSRTVEFRAMSPTTNINKSLPWLLICVGIIRFAQKYTKEIIMHKTKFYLSDIIQEFQTNFGKNDLSGNYGNTIAEYLINFVDQRRAECLEMYMTRTIFGREFQEDENYTFPGAHKIFQI